MSERTNTEPGRLVMPFYLICDVSLSMTHDMSVLNEGVHRLCRAIVAEPVVDDVAQICIMTFSDTAKIIMPMDQISESQVPMFSAEGGTNYGAAFRRLAQAIIEDNARLKAQGCKIYRPCAFFLTDGEPLDADWRQTFTNTLTYDRETGIGMKSHPIFVPFGFRDAREDVLAQLAYPHGRGMWYHSKAASADQTLTGILDIIMNTVIASGLSAEAGQPVIIQQAPPPGSGIVQGESAYDPDYV
jgi:uncharacterized protein YegL